MNQQDFIEEHGYFMADLAKGVEITASIDYTPKRNPVWLLVGTEFRQRICKGTFAEVWQAYRAA